MVARMRLAIYATIVARLPLCLKAVRKQARVARGDAHILTFGQNVWGNLAVGNGSTCGVATAAGDPELACPPMLLSERFDDPVFALGATWTHIVASGTLFSAGWAGDGNCGFSPNTETSGMKGEHVMSLTNASTRWLDVETASEDATSFKDEILACAGLEFQLSSASAAYTSSLFLSMDRTCVFTTGLKGDMPTIAMAVPEGYEFRRALKRPLPIFVASKENKVQQVLATYESNMLLMDSGDVFQARQASGLKVSATGAWTRMTAFNKSIGKLYGNGWTHFGALAKDGDFYMWGPWTPIPGITTAPQVIARGVSHVSLGPEHVLLMKPDGDAFSLWSKGGNGCGQLGYHGAGSDFAQVPGMWKDACAGYYFSMAITADGRLYLWGSINANTYHGGDGKCTKEGETHSSTPLPIEKFFAMYEDSGQVIVPSQIDTISCGFYHGMVTAKTYSAVEISDILGNKKRRKKKMIKKKNKHIKNPKKHRTHRKRGSS